MINFISSQFEKHGNYLKFCYYLAVVPTFFYELYIRFQSIGEASHAGFMPFMIALVLNMLVFMASMFISSIFNAFFVAIICLVPYLIIRGIYK